MQITVNASNLSHPDIAAHYASKDPSFRTGMRFALETLGVPLPAPLQRKSPGRKRSAQPCRDTMWRDRRRALA